MSEQGATRTVPRAGLVEVSSHLRHLLALRAAFAPFCAAVQARGASTVGSEGRRRLLTLWRPCQRRLDALLDEIPGTMWATRLRLLRQDLESGLREEVYSPHALADLVGAFDHTFESWLLEVERDLRAALVAMGETMDGGRCSDEPSV
jgi:hypothetical protein